MSEIGDDALPFLHPDGDERVRLGRRETVRRIAADKLEIPLAQITDTTSVDAIDSEFVDFHRELERYFGMEIYMRELTACATVADVVALVEKKVKDAA